MDNNAKTILCLVSIIYKNLRIPLLIITEHQLFFFDTLFLQKLIPLPSETLFNIVLMTSGRDAVFHVTFMQVAIFCSNFKNELSGACIPFL